MPRADNYKGGKKKLIFDWKCATKNGETGDVPFSGHLSRPLSGRKWSRRFNIRCEIFDEKWHIKWEVRVYIKSAQNAVKSGNLCLWGLFIHDFESPFGALAKLSTLERVAGVCC